MKRISCRLFVIASILSFFLPPLYAGMRENAPPPEGENPTAAEQPKEIPPSPPDDLDAFIEEVLQTPIEEDLDTFIERVLDTARIFGKAERIVPELEGFETFVESLLREWKVPATAVAVTWQGKIVHARGYGFRDLEARRPADADTLFAIGSITKSFTVTGLGMLADEGKLDWKKHVLDYLPDFRLHDPIATRFMTPLDLVTHRSGLPRHDLVWYGASISRDELYEKLRYLEESEEFRSAWQYQNLMFMVAGRIAEKITGMRWEDFTRKRILEPLGMTHANFSVEEMARGENCARPYTEIDGEIRRIPYRSASNVAPAGAINASVSEMIRYVRFHLDRGVWEGKRLLSENAARMMQTPQMVMPLPRAFEEVGHTSYGMGWMISTYRGNEIVQHGGGIDGFISLLTFLPEKDIGIIVLTNKSGNNPLPTIVTFDVIDRLLGLEPIDWNERFRKRHEAGEQARKAARKETGRVEGTSPSHPLEAYTGTYEHPAYGRVRITLSDGALHFERYATKATLEHFHYDIFELPKDPLDPLGEQKVTFFYDAQGHIDRLTIPLEPSVDPIEFRRVPEEAMKERAFLERFVGTYQIMTQRIEIELREDGTLIAIVPGQPPYPLSPLREQTFQIADLEGYTLEFRNDASGKVVEAVFHQPNGTFVAKRVDKAEE